MTRIFLLPAVLLTLLLLLTKLVHSACPQVCTCDRDEQGRSRTRCEGGGISVPGTFDLSQLDQDTKILIITSPGMNRPNQFTLNANMFANKRFEELHLSYAPQWDFIGERTFALVSGTLRVLNLTHNALRVVSENNFRNLSLLTDLHLDYNRIASVHSAMFSYLTGLRRLTLTNNLINDVPQRMGLQLNKLEVLDMSNNPIGVQVIESVKQTIPESFFSDFPALKILGLANTSLESLPWASMQRFNPLLKDLDLTGNRFDIIQPMQLSLIRDLKVLRIANNPIRQIAPGALSGLYLDSLDLSGLRAANFLQPGIFQNVRVGRLDLANTGLTTLDQNTFMPISRELTGLNISGNPGLLIEPQMFMRLPALKTLSMAQMSKPILPTDLFNHENALEYLDLSGNRLLQLEDGFFTPLGSLQVLILANNELNRVPNTVALPRIREIDLYNNKLTGFPDSLVNSFATPSSFMRSLKLNQNPWNCDCGVASLGRWLASNTGNQGYPAVCVGVGNFTCPVCYEPAGLRGAPLNSLPPQFLDTCAPDPVKAPSSANVDVIIAVVVCLIVLIIAILLLVLWYRNRLHSYRTYEEKRKDGDTFEHNGDVADVFEEIPPINKPKNGLPSTMLHVPPPPIGQLPKQESNV